MMATIEELTATATNVNEHQEKLNKEIINVNETILQINKFSNSIETLAGQSKLLGLNASIEAARAGEFGRGFGIVAKEIQKMASGSHDAVENIKQFTSHISDSVSDTIKLSDSTLQITRQQEEAMKRRG